MQQKPLICADLVGTQETQPLPRIEQHPFQLYLDQQRLSWSQVAREAGVLCLIVWSIAHGVAVQGKQAMRVRVAVHRLSGVAYSGPMNTHQQESVPRSRRAGAPTSVWEVRP
jgi:hypothetical protein